MVPARLPPRGTAPRGQESEHGTAHPTRQAGQHGQVLIQAADCKHQAHNEGMQRSPDTSTVQVLQKMAGVQRPEIDRQAHAQPQMRMAVVQRGIPQTVGLGQIVPVEMTGQHRGEQADQERRQVNGCGGGRRGAVTGDRWGWSRCGIASGLTAITAESFLSWRRPRACSGEPIHVGRLSESAIVPGRLGESAYGKPAIPSRRCLR